MVVEVILPINTINHQTDIINKQVDRRIKGKTDTGNLLFSADFSAAYLSHHKKPHNKKKILPSVKTFMQKRSLQISMVARYKK